MEIKKEPDSDDDYVEPVLAHNALPAEPRGIFIISVY